MEDMYVHQHAKEEPNWYRDGAVISADAHTCSPPTQTLFSLLLLFIYTYFTLKYLVKYISLEGEQIVPEVCRHYFTHMYTLNASKYISYTLN